MPKTSAMRLCQECGHLYAPTDPACPACGEAQDFLEKFQCDQCDQILETPHCVTCNAPPPLPTPPPFHIDTDGAATTDTEIAKEVDPVADSRSTFVVGLFSVGIAFCCPCISSIAGIAAIGAASNSQTRIPNEKQVGMVRFKIIATYFCGGFAILVDVIRTLVYIFSK